jgi:hypothetical protein
VLTVNSVLNLENAVFVLHFARGHYIAQLEERALKFIVSSFKALRDLHPREDLELALGAELLATLEKEQDEVDELTQRMKRTGSVVDAPSKDLATPPTDTEAAAISIARAEAEARAAAKMKAAEAEAQTAKEAAAKDAAAKEAAAKDAAAKDAAAKDAAAKDAAEDEPATTAVAAEVPPSSEPVVKLSTLSYPHLRAVIKAKGGEEPPTSCNKQGLIFRAQQVLNGQDAIPKGQLDAIVTPSSNQLPAGSNGSGTPRKFASFGGGGEKCSICSKTVYPGERIATNGRVWHQDCFRCSKCNSKLSISSYELDPQGTPFCKTHFAREWRRRSMGAATALGAQVEQGSSVTPPTPDVSEPDASHAPTIIQNKGYRRTVDGACARCGKRVYQHEMMRAVLKGGGSLCSLCYHPQCFKCLDCGTKLRPDSYELAPNNDLLCRNHYIARKNAAQGGAAAF